MKPPVIRLVAFLYSKRELHRCNCKRRIWRHFQNGIYWKQINNREQRQEPMYGEIHAPALLRIGRKMYKSQRNYENAQRAIYAGTGEYRIPVIAPENYAGCEWIGFNYINSEPDKEKKGIHFFLDDYQFIRHWTDGRKSMIKILLRGLTEAKNNGWKRSQQRYKWQR